MHYYYGATWSLNHKDLFNWKEESAGRDFETLVKLFVQPQRVLRILRDFILFTWKDAELTTNDADIARREWMLVDIDPQRPTGISSTNEEKAAAKKLAIKKFQKWITTYKSRKHGDPCKQPSLENRKAGRCKSSC